MCNVLSQVIKFYLFFNNDKFLTDNKFHAVFGWNKIKSIKNPSLKTPILMAHKSLGYQTIY